MRANNYDLSLKNIYCIYILNCGEGITNYQFRKKVKEDKKTRFG